MITSQKVREIVQQMQLNHSFGVPILALQERLINSEGVETLLVQQVINEAERSGLIREVHSNRFYAEES
jgi:hypothetical protein